jgi:hypothetical protein
MACAVLLCLTVLFWGTSYKMSLYPAYATSVQFDRSQPNPVNPPAKLLSERERPPRLSTLDYCKAIPILAVTPLLWTVVYLSSAMQVRIRVQRSRALARLARHLYGIDDSVLSHFGFRPPPSFESALS